MTIPDEYPNGLAPITWGPNDFHLVPNGTDPQGRPIHAVLPGLGPEVDAFLAKRRPGALDAERQRLAELEQRLIAEREELEEAKAELAREQKSIPTAHRTAAK